MIPLRSTRPVRTFPAVTLTLIAINILVFAWELTYTPRGLARLFAQYGVVPDQLEIQDLFTSMFLHGGWLHLIGNMWFLWVFGRNLEEALGHGRYLALYLATGVAAGLIHVFVEPFSRVPTVGASGAISGVMGAYLLCFPGVRIVTLVPVFVFLTAMEIPAAFLLLYWLLIQLFSGVGSLASETAAQGGVAWFAHVGGFLAGMLWMRLWPVRVRRPRPDVWM
jgi:membrane associated rhomboid family serine protease